MKRIEFEWQLAWSHIQHASSVFWTLIAFQVSANGAAIAYSLSKEWFPPILNGGLLFLNFILIFIHQKKDYSDESNFKTN